MQIIKYEILYKSLSYNVHALPCDYPWTPYKWECGNWARLFHVFTRNYHRQKPGWISIIKRM
jgi:hypothetical protein